METSAFHEVAIIQGKSSGRSLAMLSSIGQLCAMEYDAYELDIAHELEMSAIESGGLPEPVTSDLKCS